jgi:hypothetical protein
MTPKKISFTEDSTAKFLAEALSRHFTEEVMNLPKPEKEKPDKVKSA